MVANTPADKAQVVVADNGSTDSSLQLLAERFPSVKVIRFPENYGFAEGYNRALALTDTPYTVLLNSDVAVPQGWLEPLIDAMERDPQLGACQPKIISYRHRSRFEYAGAAGGFIDRNGYPYCRGRIFDVVEEDQGQYDTQIPVFWASGAALMVRTDLYRQVGGLDARFFAHMEEIDLCWRMQLAGYTIAAVPASEVYHLGGGSLPASNPRKTYLNFRNNLFLLYKNLPPREGRRMLLIRRLYDTLAFFVFMAKMDFANARAILRAHNDYRHQKSRYDNVRPQRSIMGDFPCCHRNIILDYNLRRIRHYSDLA